MSLTASSTPPIACSTGKVCGPSGSTVSWRRPTPRRRRFISTSVARTSSARLTSSAEPWTPARTSRPTSPTHRRHNARSNFSIGWWSGQSRRTSAVVLVALAMVSELTDVAHPARAIAHGQREWFAERFREWTTAAGVEGPESDGSRSCLRRAVRRRPVRGVRG